MNNKLIRTDKFLYRIKSFFQKLFKKRKCKDEYKVQEELKKDKFSTSLRESIVEQGKIQSLANHILEMKRQLQ